MQKFISRDPPKQVQNQSGFLQSNLGSEETANPGRGFKQLMHLDKKQESLVTTTRYAIYIKRGESKKLPVMI